MATILNNIAAMFRPVQAVSQQVPVAPPMAQVNPGAGAPVPPAGTSNPTAGETVPNPLEAMAALWQNDPKVQQPVDPFATPLLSADPAAIQAAASKMDFIGQLPPDMLQAAMSGTDPQAFMKVMNAVAQKAVATSAQLSAATIEQATTRNNARVQQSLPGRVKQIQLDAMQAEHPVLQHPASQPFLNLVRSQIQSKNPGMSAVEINRRAESALTGFASQLTAPTQAEKTAESGAGTDWESWAST